LIISRHVIGYAVTAVAAQAEKPAQVNTTIKTVDVPGPATTVTSPPVTVTVKVPGPTTTKTVTVTAPAPAPATAMAGEGTYEVGVDVQPGTYISAPTSDNNCYWARMKAGDGQDNIIANNNTTGSAVVVIRASDKFFTSSGCSDWTQR
jgi:hypothetical protein